MAAVENDVDQRRDQGASGPAVAVAGTGPVGPSAWGSRPGRCRLGCAARCRAAASVGGELRGAARTAVRSSSRRMRAPVWRWPSPRRWERRALMAAGRCKGPGTEGVRARRIRHGPRRSSVGTADRRNTGRQLAGCDRAPRTLRLSGPSLGHRLGPAGLGRRTRRGLPRLRAWSAADRVVARRWSPAGGGDRVCAEFSFEQLEQGLFFRGWFRWPQVGLVGGRLR